MDGIVTQHDWTLIKSFATVGECGSLSAASRAIGTAQSTISRHISTLEQEVGTRLFERAASGVVLTPTGVELMRSAQAMADAAGQFSKTIKGNTDVYSGSVRITASKLIATYVLPDLLHALRQQERGIALEVVASDRSENLLRREADIAIRMHRPTQPDIITRKLGQLYISAYASRSYLNQRGTPETMDDLLKHDFIGYDQSTLIIDGFHKFGMKVTREFFAFRSDDQAVCWQMVLAGYGIGFVPREIGLATPDVVELGFLSNVGSLPVWLATHAEVHTNPRIRRVYDFLAENSVIPDEVN